MGTDAAGTTGSEAEGEAGEDMAVILACAREEGAGCVGPNYDRTSCRGTWPRARSCNKVPTRPAA